MLKVTSNFGEVSKRLNELAQRARDLDGQHSVPLPELMPPGFVSGCSSFATVEGLFAASPFTINTPDDFKAIGDDAWDSFINENTSFHTWREMQEAAVKEWTRRKLGFND